jgi:hypothetical protein
MKFKKIVGFGDSWMYGDELIDPVLAAQEPDSHCSWTQNIQYRESHCFLGLLGDHYSVPTENFGLPGGSFQSMIWSFLWWLENEPDPESCLILCGLTEEDRHSFYHPSLKTFGNHPSWDKFVHTTWINYGSSVVPREYHDLGKRYIALTHCDELSKNNYSQAVLLFDGIASRRNLNLLQFHTSAPPIDWRLPTQIWPGFDLILFFRDHPDNQQRELIKPNGHPNETGHEIIRDMLINEIDRAILVE